MKSESRNDYNSVGKRINVITIHRSTNKLKLTKIYKLNVSRKFNCLYYEFIRAKFKTSKSKIKR